ncbi:hypothetical protein KJ693_06855 [bacterium]|nr:hypothetical protein [bacterium]MBU1615021.1 hypothetical protein [bacterium]
MKPFNSFSDTASMPFFWWVKADDLFSAATAIMESWTAAKAAHFDPLPKESGWVKLTPRQQEASHRLRFPQVYLFIVGLAFENLIKGLLIARDPGLVKDGKLSADISTGHGLSHLFVKADIPLSEQENNFIDRLSDSVLWAGRYPIPKTENKWGIRLLPDGNGFLPGTFFENDVANAKKLWRRVLKIVAIDPAAPKYSAVDPAETEN